MENRVAEAPVFSASAPGILPLHPVACAKWKSKFNHKVGFSPPKYSPFVCDSVVSCLRRHLFQESGKVLEDGFHGCRVNHSGFHFENETDMRQVLLQDEGRDRQPSKDEDISWHAEGKGGLNEEDDSDDFDGQPETKNYGKSKPHHSSGKHKHNRSKHFILLL
ncbi:hypothetical protein Taro_012167 [Colocasia esculenta]|uniref:Uncharacterized protein n=1 Tax=Colocasia esculenta TaxID=4460 RepID=A0A843U8A2_COLES|nr:hypothetical protein [Colocasia esculenta]